MPLPTEIPNSAFPTPGKGLVVDLNGLVPVGVLAPSPANGYVLTYDSATGQQKWAAVSVTQPSARAYHNANQAITTGTVTALALNSERWDTDTIHDTSTNNSRLTCKTAGKYDISGSVFWDVGATGKRAVTIRLNGTTDIASQSAVNQGAGDGVQLTVATIYDLAVNDYVELTVLHNQGANLNVLVNGNNSPEFSMARVSA